jgi:hypothetical protein
MPFRNDHTNAPRHSAPDETAGELPPDLAALGRELSCDADLLARVFPASERGASMAIATCAASAHSALRSDAELHIPRHKRWRWSIVGGASAAAVLVAVLSWQAAGPLHDEAVGGRDGSAAGARPSQLAQLDGASGRAGPAAAEPMGITENVFTGLSGAEEEAVLDLLESDADQTASLSI